MASLAKESARVAMLSMPQNERTIVAIVFSLSSLLSIGTACISIALAAQQSRNRAVLIIIACSDLIFGLFGIPVLVKTSIRSQPKPCTLVTVLGTTLLQLLILGSTVEYFFEKNSVMDIPSIIRYRHLSTAFESVLLFAMFVNGIAITVLAHIPSTAKDNEVADDSQPSINEKEGLPLVDDKYVPLKNSSQTLTPNLDLNLDLNSPLNNQNAESWMNSAYPRQASASETSQPSVLLHQLSGIGPNREDSNISNLTSKSINQKLKASVKKRKNSLFKHLSRKVPKEDAAACCSYKANQLDAKYITRMSVISDFSKSVLNMINPSQLQYPSKAGLSNDFLPEPCSLDLNNPGHSIQLATTKEFECVLQNERDAVKRIDSALLPPILNIGGYPITEEECVQQTPKISRALSPLIPVNDEMQSVYTKETMETLQLSELEDIPRLPVQGESSRDAELPQNITLDMWQQNKEGLLNNVSTARDPKFSLNPEALPKEDFVLDSNEVFSFPPKPDDSFDTKPQKDIDAISELDKYLNDLKSEDEESQLLEDGFHQNQTASYIMERASKELYRTNTKHSPTKSIVSIISAATSLHQQKSQNALSSFRNTSPSHRKTSSQVSTIVNAQRRLSSTMSPPPSPSRSQRLKRISKKLSLSNISDSMINSFNTDAKSAHDNFVGYGDGKKRGQSIDFSYVHTLQNHHSPSKSAVVLNSSSHQSKNSLVQADGINSYFYAQHQNQNFLVDNTEKTYGSTRIPSLSYTGTSVSKQQVLNYNSIPLKEHPEAIMGEYDLEKMDKISHANKE